MHGKAWHNPLDGFGAAHSRTGVRQAAPLWLQLHTHNRAGSQVARQAYTRAQQHREESWMVVGGGSHIA